MKIIGTLAEMEARAERRPQTRGQVEKFRRVLADHPEAIAVECADEKTGARFGRAKKRLGQCAKLGHAAQPLWYQIWATWASADLTTI